MFNSLRNSFWNDPIKWISIIFASMLLSTPISSALLDPFDVLHCAEINDSEMLCHSFLENDDLSIQEMRQFLIEIFSIIQSQYPSNISLHELKSIIIELIKICDIDQNSFYKIQPILPIIIDQLIPNEEKIGIILTKSPLKQPTSEIQAPSSLVFGGAELICGALLWLTPFKPIGLILISDGVRRIGNVVDEKDKELREHPERQYHPNHSKCH